MPANNILIAVPTTGGLMKSKTALTLIALVKRLTREGINVDYRTLDSADIVIARNYFANLVLETPQIDALLFVDSDMQFHLSL